MFIAFRIIRVLKKKRNNTNNKYLEGNTNFRLTKSLFHTLLVDKKKILTK